MKPNVATEARLLPHGWCSDSIGNPPLPRCEAVVTKWTPHRLISMGLRLLTSGGLALAVAASAGSQAPAQHSGRFAVEVLDGASLQSDGKGPYVDARGLVGTVAVNGIALCMNYRICGTLPARPPATASDRALMLDLRHPVLSSGARDLGLVRATPSNFGVLWEQDSTRLASDNASGQARPVIRPVLSVPVGHSVVSQRVELRFFRDGVQHILQFGPWVAGQYQTQQGRYTGDGTTRGTIAHPSATEWVVRSGAASLGRLWDNQDPAHPKDLGLYRFSYAVRFRDLPPPTVSALVAGLADTNRAARRGRWAIRSLSKHAAPYVDALLPRLADARPAVRLGAMDALVTIGAGTSTIPLTAAPRLRAALADTLADVRSGVIALLLYVAPQEPATAAAFLHVLRSDPHGWPRYRAAALIDSVPAANRDTVIAALMHTIDDDPDPDVRDIAIETLRRIAPTDPRTAAILGRLLENPRQAHVSAHPAIFTILARSASLRSDGQGPYDQAKGAMTYFSGAAGVATWRNLDMLTNRPDSSLPPVPKVRSLVFDLTHPVAGSGAMPLGVVQDSVGRFHAFWRYSEAGGARRILGFEQVGPVGTSVESDRVEMWVRAGRDQYLLQMGPWGMGMFSDRGRVSGQATTRARITRTGPRTWRVEAPQGSVAQLWNVNDVQRPVPGGLYEFSFAVEFERP
jgi:hypothetical protein